MSKLILLLSFICLSILLIFGLVAPDSPVMWLASTSYGFALLRAGCMAVLLYLLVTEPPRSKFLRALIGAASLVMVSWTLNATYNNDMKIVDALALLEVSIAAGITVLEREYDYERYFQVPRKNKPHHPRHA